MNKLIIILLFLPFFVFGQDENIQVKTMKLENIIYNTKSGGIDTFIVVNSDGTATFTNLSAPVDGSDAVSLSYVSGLPSSGFDSIDFNEVNSGLLRFLIGGSIFNTVDLDDRYAIGDSSEYIKNSDTLNLVVTITQLVDSMTVLNSSQKVIYSITLPNASTVSDRIAAATEGTDYPTGWVLTPDGLNINIEHNLNRRCADVSIWVTTSGTIQQKLTGTNAYNGLFSLDLNTVKINSLSIISSEITIYLIME